LPACSPLVPSAAQRPRRCARRQPHDCQHLDQRPDVFT
jgi:hypothetical protein